MLVDSVTSRTYLQGLLRRVTKDHFEVFDYLEWRDSVGLDELRKRTDLYRPAWIEAVSKLRTDLDYISHECEGRYRYLTFSGKVKVFPNDIPCFAFTRNWYRPYVWLRPSEVHSLELTPGSIAKLEREEAERASHCAAWERAARIARGTVV